MSPAKKKAKKGGEVMTCMEFVNAVWGHRFPGCKPPSGTATALAPIYKELGDEEASRRLSNYLASTPAQYVNMRKFVSVHAAFTETYAKPARATVVNPSPPTTTQTVEVGWDPIAGRLKFLGLTPKQRDD